MYRRNRNSPEILALLEAASAMGFQTELEMEGLEVSVYDGVATSAGYLAPSTLIVRNASRASRQCTLASSDSPPHYVNWIN